MDYGVSIYLQFNLTWWPKWTHRSSHAHKSLPPEKNPIFLSWLHVNLALPCTQHVSSLKPWNNQLAVKSDGSKTIRHLSALAHFRSSSIHYRLSRLTCLTKMYSIDVWNRKQWSDDGKQVSSRMDCSKNTPSPSFSHCALVLLGMLLGLIAIFAWQSHQSTAYGFHRSTIEQSRALRCIWTAYSYHPTNSESMTSLLIDHFSHTDGKGNYKPW